MASKIKLGFVGANLASVWASQSHFPALLASPDVELTAVCTTRRESAEEARAALGAKLAFDDVREMVAADIDAVAVVVRVPNHYEPTRLAIEAGKHVYTEWPLGRTTDEAVELARLARERGVQAVVGLQSRVSPALMHMKDLVETGYVGELLSCHLRCVRQGSLEHPSTNNWHRDPSLGVSTLTVATGHVIDALRFVVGEFERVTGMVTTQATHWYEPDTGSTVEVSSPDTVMVSGRLARGAVASVHVAGAPWAPSGFRLELYGPEGTLVATGAVSSQRGEALRLQGARGGHELEDLDVPERFAFVPRDFPQGDPYNVGQMYALFAEAIRTGRNRLPTFDTAVDLHRLLDAIQRASDSARETEVD